MGEVIASTALLLSERLAVTRDTVRQASGRVEQWEIVRKPDAVAVLALDEDARILLVQQYRPAADAVLWELPAGLIEENETPEDAAFRELVEETGYEAEDLFLLSTIYPSPGWSTERIHLFLTETTRPGSAPYSGEVLQARWLEWEEVEDLIDEGVIVDAKTLAALYLAEAWITEADEEEPAASVRD